MSRMHTFVDFCSWAGSQARAARMLGVSRSYVCRLVKGDVEMTRQIASKVEEVSHGLFKKERVLWPEEASSKMERA